MTSWLYSPPPSHPRLPILGAGAVEVLRSCPLPPDDAFDFLELALALFAMSNTNEWSAKQGKEMVSAKKLREQERERSKERSPFDCIST